jgi:hypothetical protein
MICNFEIPWGLWCVFIRAAWLPVSNTDMVEFTRSSIFRRAKALGWVYEAHLRGLIQAALAAFVVVARPFTGRAGVWHGATAYVL